VARREPGDGPPLLPLLTTLLCALCGGLLASRFLSELGWAGPGWSRPLVVVPLCAATGAAVAFWLLTSPRPARRLSPPPRAPGPAVEQAHLASAAARSGPATAERAWWAEPAGQARAGPPGPVGSPVGSGPAEHTAPVSGDSWPGAAAPLSGDGEQPPLVAQCPRCGEFRLDSARNGPAYTFRCQHPGCGYTWGWTPGAAWPAVVVRRNLATGPSANHGQQSNRAHHGHRTDRTSSLDTERG